MKKLILVIIIGIFLISNGTAQESGYERVSEFSEESNVILNDQLRSLFSRINDIEAGVSLTAGVTGILPLDNGGTGQDLSTNNQGDIYYDGGSNGFTRLTPGTSGYFLKTQGAAANPVWSQVGQASNIIFSWSGIEAGTNTHGSYLGNLLIPIISGGAGDDYFFAGAAGTTLRTVMNFRFKKVSGVSTVTIQARIWSSITDPAKESICTVDIGGASNAVKREAATPGWATAADIDVSGLSDGTTYSGVIQLSNEDASEESYCSAIILIGS